MTRHNTTSPLSIDLRNSVLERLGFSAPPDTDLNGLRLLYQTWCHNIPFDNVRKMITLRSPGVNSLPGANADEFFEKWLTDGSGGTCWSTSNALFELAASLGFEVKRIVGCMRDLGIVNHASISIHIDGCDWLVDTSLLFNIPVPLDQHIFVGNDPVLAVEIEPTDDGDHLLWVDVPPNNAYLPCRLRPAKVDYARYLAYYEASRERSPFNQRLYARRNREGELILLMGNVYFSRTAKGLDSHQLSAEETKQCLREDIGLSDRLIDDWVKSGSLNASFEPLIGPKPPLTGKPPSQRQQ